MKIFAIPSFINKTNLYNNISNMSNNRQILNAGLPVALNKDTVSFKRNEECSGFGFIGTDFEASVKPADINDYFKIVKNSEDGIPGFESFEWTTNNGKLKFFGDEKVLDEFLTENHSSISDFKTESNQNNSFVTYSDGVFKYNLKYSKIDNKLQHASAELLKKDKADFERFDLKPSENNYGKFIAKYAFISEQHGETAIENTYLLFDEDMTVEKLQTASSFQYSDGEIEENKFGFYYEPNGEISDVPEEDFDYYLW